MPYYHQFIDSSQAVYPVGKVVCVGRNYIEHTQELANPKPASPLLFIKPSTAIQAIDQPINLPVFAKECHYEVELAVLIGKKLSQASSEESAAAIAGYGLALDLTLRDLQQELKQQGYPWEKAKAFDGSCPMTGFVTPEQIELPCQFSLAINGIVKQQGNTSQMLWPINALLIYISQYFTLLPGDVVLTGTPAGVGSLQPGDLLTLDLAESYSFAAKVS